MFNRSEIFKAAWTEFLGHTHRTFASCLANAWYRAKLDRAAEVSRAERIAKAAEVIEAAKADAVPLLPAVEARRAEIRAQLLDLELGDFIDWNRHRELSVELFRAA